MSQVNITFNIGSSMYNRLIDNGLGKEGLGKEKRIGGTPPLNVRVTNLPR